VRSSILTHASLQARLQNDCVGKHALLCAHMTCLQGGHVGGNGEEFLAKRVQGQPDGMRKLQMLQYRPLGACTGGADGKAMQA